LSFCNFYGLIILGCQIKWQATIALCAVEELVFLLPEQMINKITNDDIKKQMFGDAFQARTKAE